MQGAIPRWSVTHWMVAGPFTDVGGMVSVTGSVVGPASLALDTVAVRVPWPPGAKSPEPSMTIDSFGAAGVTWTVPPPEVCGPC